MLDLIMPSMSGFEVLACLAVCAVKPRFVVVMSAAPQVVIARAAARNVFAALQKPAGIDEIVATVRACLAAA